MYPVKRKESSCVHMLQKENCGVEYLEFSGLSQLSCIKHLFTTRLGGVSEGIYASMNLSFTRGDEEEKVLANFDKIAEVLSVSREQFVLSHQTHTDHVRVVFAKDGGNGLSKPLQYSDVDGLITNEKGLVLSTFYADCVPVYLVDPVREVIGLCHSGWKGTVAEIGLKTVRLMEQEFSCNPKDIYGAIAPSICMDCYEVSADVIDEIKKTYDVVHHEELFYEKNNGKFQLNLWKACELTLLKAGLTPEHIEITDICTCCNPEYLFSHRASDGKRGNLGAFLMLK